jgi:hypothetical protein
LSILVRSVLFAIGVLLLAAALVAALAGGPVALVVWCGLVGLMLTAGIAFERGRYKANAGGRPGPGWIAHRRAVCRSD